MYCSISVCNIISCTDYIQIRVYNVLLVCYFVDFAFGKCMEIFHVIVSVSIMVNVHLSIQSCIKHTLFWDICSDLIMCKFL